MAKEGGFTQNVGWSEELGCGRGGLGIGKIKKNKTSKMEKKKVFFLYPRLPVARGRRSNTIKKKLGGPKDFFRSVVLAVVSRQRKKGTKKNFFFRKVLTRKT